MVSKSTKQSKREGINSEICPLGMHNVRAHLEHIHPGKKHPEGLVITRRRHCAKNPSRNLHKMSLSKRGLDFIVKHEGRKVDKRGYHYVYDDLTGKPINGTTKPKGKSTIGYGHLILPGEKFGKISEEEAKKLFSIDLAKTEKVIRRFIHVPLSQSQFDALMSFVFNVGPNPLKSSIAEFINKGKYDAAADRFALYNKARNKVNKGLTLRREDEANLFRDGEY